jgi:hypothetical protein
VLVTLERIMFGENFMKEDGIRMITGGLMGVEPLISQKYMQRDGERTCQQYIK